MNIPWSDWVRGREAILFVDEFLSKLILYDNMKGPMHWLVNDKANDKVKTHLKDAMLTFG